MTENTEFTPEQQTKVDEIVKSRIAREKERWEKDSGVLELQQQLEAKDEEIATIKREHYLEKVVRSTKAELASRGVEDEGRIQRIMKLIDLEAIEAGENGAPDRGQVLSQVDSVALDVPELVRPRGARSGGSERPVIEPSPKPLTREEIEAMSREEQNRPGMKERIDAFLRGERG